GMRNRPYVSTKGGMVWDERREVGHRLKAASVRRECEASLRRLGVEAIDLYQVHWPDPDGEIEEGWATLAALKEEGKVRHIGVSHLHVAPKEATAASPAPRPPSSLLPRGVGKKPRHFGARQHVGVIASSPMASGLLTGAMTRERIARLPADDWRKRHPDFQEPLLSRNLRLVRL